MLIKNPERRPEIALMRDILSRQIETQEGIEATNKGIASIGERLGYIESLLASFGSRQEHHEKRICEVERRQQALEDRITGIEALFSKGGPKAVGQ